MTLSERLHLSQETDIEFLEICISRIHGRVYELLSIETVFVQDSRGVREVYSRDQIRENRVLAAELQEDAAEYEERISVLRAEAEVAESAA